MSQQQSGLWRARRGPSNPHNLNGGSRRVARDPQSGRGHHDLHSGQDNRPTIVTPDLHQANQRSPSNPHYLNGGGRRDASDPQSDRGYHDLHSRQDNRPTIVTPDLRQANQPSSCQVLANSSTWQAGSSSSSSLQNLDKKSSSSEISEQFRKLSVHSKFPSRPGFGKKGLKCMVTANHFFIELDPSLQYIYHYNVTITPEVTSKALNRVVMEELVKSYKRSGFGNILLAYDGQSSFYTANPLPFNSKEFDITITNEGGAKRKFDVAISLVSMIDLEKLRDFLAGKHDNLSQEAIQAFDIVLRQTPLLKFVPVKRSFHSSSPTGRNYKIGDGLEAWSGFYQSVRLTQMGLSLNFDISAAVFVQQLDVTKYVEEILNIKNLSITRSLSDAERLKVKRALKGLKVEVKHRQNVHRKYTISGLTVEPTKELIFPFGDNGEMKYVVQYFREKYNCNLRYTSLPCLQVGNNATFLPMEVCKIVGGQRYTKRLNEKQTSAMVKLNSLEPRNREARILEMVSINDYPKDQYAKEFGVSISESPASVQARILPSPQLKYHHNNNIQPQFGQWNMNKKKVFKGGKVSYWSCLNFAVSDDFAEKFCKELALFCKTHGMNFNPEPVLSPRRASVEQVERFLETLQKDAMAKLEGKELDLLIVILPDNNGSLYGEVKRICETKIGILSQCVLAKTVQSIVKSGGAQSLANIVLKINTKVGGINVVLRDALPMVSDKPTIIFGADVTHPTPGDDVSPSIAAVVASQNWPNVTNYVSKLSAQAGGKEIIQDLDRMVKEHFHSFVENNGTRPERIIFYRDGVSEGQFNQVLECELKAFQKAWVDEFKESIVPPITFVVVQKRHHTKLFPVNGSKSVDRSGNILPGTVVDSDICHPNQFDFYLCSHAGIKGTSRPAHYHVLWDENKFTADDLQTLTNNLCYIYARCTRAVSYVSPAYYAHLAAFRARFYFGNDSFSDESSVGRTCQATVAPVKQLPRICDNLKNLPFYC